MGPRMTLLTVRVMHDDVGGSWIYVYEVNGVILSVWG